jgi:hypothetical protein
VDETRLRRARGSGSLSARATPHKVFRVGEARFHVVYRERWMCRKELGEIRVVGKLIEHWLHGDASTTDDRLAGHDVGVLDVAVVDRTLSRHA